MSSPPSLRALSLASSVEAMEVLKAVEQWLDVCGIDDAIRIRSGREPTSWPTDLGPENLLRLAGRAESPEESSAALTALGKLAERGGRWRQAAIEATRALPVVHGPARRQTLGTLDALITRADLAQALEDVEPVGGIHLFLTTFVGSRFGGSEEPDRCVSDLGRQPVHRGDSLAQENLLPRALPRAGSRAAEDRAQPTPASAAPAHAGSSPARARLRPDRLPRARHRPAHRWRSFAGDP